MILRHRVVVQQRAHLCRTRADDDDDNAAAAAAPTNDGFIIQFSSGLCDALASVTVTVILSEFEWKAASWKKDGFLVREREEREMIRKTPRGGGGGAGGAVGGVGGVGVGPSLSLGAKEPASRKASGLAQLVSALHQNAAAVVNSKTQLNGPDQVRPEPLELIPSS